jgi:hypothetical protein
MENDTDVANGLAGIQAESMCGDKVPAYICNNCGNLANFDTAETRIECTYCRYSDINRLDELEREKEKILKEANNDTEVVSRMLEKFEEDMKNNKDKFTKIMVPYVWKTYMLICAGMGVNLKYHIPTEEEKKK